MKKKLPKLKNDNEFGDFLDNNDLSDYFTKDDLKPMSFEIKKKDTQITLRLPSELLTCIKKKAKKEKINYQKYIRLILSKNIVDHTDKKAA